MIYILRKPLPLNSPELPKVQLAGHGWARLESFLVPSEQDISGLGWEITPLAFITLPSPGGLPQSGGTSNDTHPHGGLATMGLLQPEDLGHHVLCGGVQQDPS